LSLASRRAGLSAITTPPDHSECNELVRAYERLTALYHDLLGQESLDDLLGRAAEAVADLVPCSALLIAETDASEQVIVPLLASGDWCQETLQMRPSFGEGLIGWAVASGQAVMANEAHLDPRAGHVAGTPAGAPEALICLPLISGGEVIGALSLYREGDYTWFSDAEFAMARRFADAVTLALANAQARRQLTDVARTDYLTGALNRRGFHQELTTLKSRAGRADQTIALLLIDLDDFKSVNDRFGHPVGDMLLQQVAAQLSAHAPVEAAVARLGGDEFALLFLPERPGEAARVAGAVAESLNPLSFVSANGAVSITASVGSAELPATEHTLDEELLATADASMYERKLGRDKAEVSRGRRSRRDGYAGLE
jgi:diguanylate cyclase (GGDEF)-like protein